MNELNQLAAIIGYGVLLYLAIDASVFLTRAVALYITYRKQQNANR
ncbi:hypothetical protein ENHY17A_110234 [Moraxellaceae bacterium 17A]|nr:hypothetical protein ENHY17A_110234 [Moraxellaceae bacterium 17A]